jgi:hypothetical protein
MNVREQRMERNERCIGSDAFVLSNLTRVSIVRLLGRLRGESGVDGTDLDVRVDDRGIGVGTLNISGVTRAGGAGSTGDTRLGGILIKRVVRVEPEHVGVVVIPERQDENHAAAESITHSVQATMLVEDVLVAKGLLLSNTEIGVNGVAGNTIDVGLGVGNDLAVLDVETLDLSQAAARSDELGDNGELAAGVDSHTLAVEGLVAHTPRVEVAAIRITSTSIAGIGVGTTAVIAIAPGLLRSIAGVRGDGSTLRVGLPDVHLGTARAIATNTSVLVVVGRLPALNVGLQTQS